jgi:hypothetical protein
LLHINESTTSDKHESHEPQFKIILSMHILLLSTTLLYHITDYIYGILQESYETVIELKMKVHHIINMCVLTLSLLGSAHRMYNTDQVHSTLDLELHENTFSLGY